MMTFEEANRLWSYDPKTGHVFWKIFASPKATPGMIAGNSVRKGNTSYRMIKIKGVNYRAHRIAWLLYTGEWPAGLIDHEDHNGLNNKLGNLRVVSQRQNIRNSSRHCRNKSGVTGVCWSERYGKWIAQIYGENGIEPLGKFKSKKEAVAVRKAAEIKYGYHPNHGKIK